MKTRVLTGLFLAAVAVLFLFFSDLPFFLSTVCALISLRCIRELWRADQKPRLLRFCLSAFGGVLCSFIPVRLLRPEWLFCAFLLFSALGFRNMHLVSAQKKSPRTDCLPYWLIPLLLQSVRMLRHSDVGLPLLITALLCAIANDTGAYFAGKKFGKNPLAPRISPNKTVEGFLGGVLTCLVLFGVSIPFFRLCGTPQTDLFSFLLYLLSASAVGTLGDLFFSAVKRLRGIKDFGSLLPGHGGLLDRLDSLFCILPFTFLFHCICPLF